ncbi:uncharacterized protein EAE97_004589 [Botrytis byssoidea]|uniref:Uncharacterized protein n=1 Tax=Botrytis byssoidea TaxID=139641 RepID=A0A9P5IQA2_9HELO|nr:uncharacterized protein EAE97_004589 [Botrytis byssoidea]KAF7947340.1 hypothetical protein EAE97_004589 [Botrytis byssoidea]
MLDRDHSLYIDHPRVNDNKYKVLECLLKSGLVVNNVRIDPRWDWSPLAMAVHVDCGWDLLLKEGVIIDDTCMERLENICHEEGNLVRRFIDAATENNISIDIKPRFIKLVLRQEGTSHRGLELLSESNDMDDLPRREVALQKASLFGQTQIVKDILSEEDLDVNFCAPETDYLTTINSASTNGHIDVVRILIDHGAALEVHDSRSNPKGIHQLATFMIALVKGHMEVAMLLEAAGADINKLVDCGTSALHYTAMCSVTMVEYILNSPKFHQTVSVRSLDNFTVPIAAVMLGDMDNIKYVLKRSNLSDILARCTNSERSGYTALHFAVSYNLPRILIETLIQSGFEVSLETDSRFTPLHIAAACDNIELFRAMMWFTERELLLNPSSARNLFQYTSIVNHAACIQDTVSKWSSPSIHPLDHPTEPRLSVLLYIIHERWSYPQQMFQALQMFLSRPGINLEPKDAEGRSPLVILCQELAKSDKPDQWDNWTTLHNSINLLIRRGADVLSQDARGNTALHYMCEVAFLPHHFGALLILLYEPTPILLCFKPNNHSIESYRYKILNAKL